MPTPTDQTQLSDFLAQLSNFTFVENNALKVDHTQCPICHEDTEAHTVKTMCDHTFHRECLMKWLQTLGNRSGTCPSCRTVFYQGTTSLGRELNLGQLIREGNAALRQYRDNARQLSEDVVRLRESLEVLCQRLDGSGAEPNEERELMLRGVENLTSRYEGIAGEDEALEEYVSVVERVTGGYNTDAEAGGVQTDDQ